MGKDKHEESNRRGRRRKPSGGVADWDTCDPTVLRTAIAAVARTGGALRLGYTRDGGAYAIGVYGDGDPYTDYVKPSEDISQVMREIAEAYAD